jgi:HK97 family phage prohead protease
MPMKLLSAEDFRSAAKDGDKPDGTVFRFATAEPQNVEGATRTKRFVFSDATIDHAGDSIDPKGWDLAVFKSNPVALFSHMSWEPPIGRASNVGVDKGKLVGDIEFASADVYQFADTIYRLVEGGFMNAVSVGFRPKEWAFTNDKDRPYGIDFKKQVLLEISVCPVPCNPSALTEARSAGIDTAPLIEWAEKVLDSGDTVFLPRKDLEALRLQSKTGADPRYYLQSTKEIAPSTAEKVRDAVKRWQADPAEVLILADGLELRQIANETDLTKMEMADTGDVDADFATAMIAHHKLAIPMADKEIKGGSDAAMLELAKSIVSDQTAQIADMEKWLAEHKKTGKGMESGGVRKAGRRVSASTRAKLMEVIAMHGDATKRVMEAIGEDDGEDPEDEPGRGEPEGSVVLESETNLVTMTPAEMRLKEVADMRAALPVND